MEANNSALSTSSGISASRVGLVLGPTAFLAILLNLVLPEEIDETQTEEISGGLSGQSSGKV